MAEEKAEGAFKFLAADIRAEQKGRMAALRQMFEAGGAESSESGKHVRLMIGALAATGCWETVAIMFRSFGYSENRILEAIKDYMVIKRKPVSTAWSAFRVAQINPDAQALIDALEEIDAASSSPLDEDIPL